MHGNLSNQAYSFCYLMTNWLIVYRSHTAFWCFQAQSQVLWKLRDSLNRNVPNDVKKELLTHNNQDIPSGESRVSVSSDRLCYSSSSPSSKNFLLVTMVDCDCSVMSPIFNCFLAPENSHTYPFHDVISPSCIIVIEPDALFSPALYIASEFPNI